jgi:hypothetical protein
LTWSLAPPPARGFSLHGPTDARAFLDTSVAAYNGRRGGTIIFAA